MNDKEIFEGEILLNTETKQPAAGEYWEINSVDQPYRVRIIAVDQGDVVVRRKSEGIDYWLQSDDMVFTEHARHLPNCDSFDWKETVYPRYAVPSTDNDTAFKDISFITLEKEGDSWFITLKSGDKAHYRYNSDFLKSDRWKLVSREEAEARHARLHREWVISQLVVIDRDKWPDHVPRPGVDWRRDNITNKPDEPIKPIKAPEGTVNFVFPAIKHYDNSIHYCLPKDLPPEPPAAVKLFRTVDIRVHAGGTAVVLHRVPIHIAGTISVDAFLMEYGDGEGVQTAFKRIELTPEVIVFAEAF